MKTCPNCTTEVEDAAAFCPKCGASFYSRTPMRYDPFDHTSEFDAKDISDNKVIAMLIYLMGWVGIVIALLISNSSPYVAFHMRQGLKFVVIQTLCGMAAVYLCFTIIVPIAAVIFGVVLTVIQIICFFQICSGKAVEPYLIRNFQFLK